MEYNINDSYKQQQRQFAEGAKAQISEKQFTS